MGRFSMSPPGPWRKVVDCGPFIPGGRNGGAYRYTLECGHTEARKASDGTPKKLRCQICQMKGGK